MMSFSFIVVQLRKWHTKLKRSREKKRRMLYVDRFQTPKVWGSMPMGKINLFVLPIFPVFAFKIMHRVTLLTRCCKLF